MKFSYDLVFAVFLGIIAASLVEHLIIAPRMAHSPGKTLPSTLPIARTSTDWVLQNFPDAMSV